MGRRAARRMRREISWSKRGAGRRCGLVLAYLSQKVESFFLLSAMSRSFICMFFFVMGAVRWVTFREEMIPRHNAMRHVGMDNNDLIIQERYLQTLLFFTFAFAI